MPSLRQVVSKIISNNNDNETSRPPPPTELGYMHFPCSSYDGKSRPDKYRAAMRDLQDGDFMLFKADSVPSSAGGWGCMIRLEIRADVSLSKQFGEIKKTARCNLEYLLQKALTDEQTESVACGKSKLPLSK